MAVVTPIEGLHSISFFKKFGLPNGFGEIWFGYSEFGDDNPYSAIYRRNFKKSGEVISRIRYYCPPASRSVAQATRRDLFVAAVLAWQNLTSSERQTWREKAIRTETRGYNLFLSSYIHDHA